MKTIILGAMSLMLTLAAPAAHAQQKIESAYAAFMRKVKVDPKPNIIRDPQTMELQGRADTYEFAIPDRDQVRIDDVRKAMLSETDNAYKVYSASDYTHQRRLTYGNGQAVTIGSRYCNYLAVLFADRQLPCYRTAYCIEWLFPAEGKIRGRLIRVYGPDPKRHTVVPNGAALVGDTLARVPREAWLLLAHQIDSVLTSATPTTPTGKATGQRPGAAEVQARIKAVNQAASVFCKRYNIRLKADKVTTQQLSKAAAEGRDQLMALLSQGDYTAEYCALQADMLMDVNHLADIDSVAASANLRDQEKMNLILTTITRRFMQCLAESVVGRSRPSAISRGATLDANTQPCVSSKAWIRLARQADRILATMTTVPTGNGGMPCLMGVPADVDSVFTQLSRLTKDFCGQHHINMRPYVVRMEVLTRAPKAGRDRLMAWADAGDGTPEFCELWNYMVENVLHTINVNRVATSTNLRDKEKLRLILTSVTRQALQRLVGKTAGK